MRRPGPIRRVFFWVLTLCFLITAALWVYSIFRSIDYSYPCALPALATTRFAAWNAYGAKENHLRPGAILLNVPVYVSPPLTSPRWQVFPPNSTRFPMLPRGTSFMTPTLFRQSGAVVIPIWLPFLLFGIPCAILWRKEIQRRRLLSRARGAKIIRERFGPKMTRLLPIATGIIALIITPFALDLFEQAIPALDIRKFKGKLEHYSETLYLALLLFTWLITSYFVAKLLLRRLRWKTDYEHIPTCNRCGYNLTGNQSGICPECGSSITKNDCQTESPIGTHRE